MVSGQAECTESKIIKLKLLQACVIRWANEHRPGWRDQTFAHIGIDSVGSIAVAIMSDEAIARLVTELDNSIRSADDLEEMLLRYRDISASGTKGRKWIHSLFKHLRDIPTLLKGVINKEENGLGPFADLSPDERDAKKREIWDWKLRYLNYMARMEQQEVEEVEVVEE
ncbi:hypothetical protein ACHAWC_010461 [Mediolabrus comicus]